MIKLATLYLLLSSFFSSVHAGIIVKDIWKQKEITVCFSEAELYTRETVEHKFKAIGWKDEEKKLIQEWIDEEFTQQETKISFKGWKNCSEADFPDVILFRTKVGLIKKIFVDSAYAYVFNIGMKNSSVDGYPTAENALVLSQYGLTRTVVIHEFGHILGLGHEHHHPSAYTYEGKNCDATSALDSNYSKKNMYTGYDPNSIMNYCYIYRSDNLGLSEYDKLILSITYD